MSLVTQRYGKDNVKLIKVIHSDGRQQKVIELSVQVLLSGDKFTSSYTVADNSLVIPTDTVKNTIYYLAHKHPIDSIESFASHVISHFLSTFAHVQSVHVKIDQFSWVRIITTTDKPVNSNFSGSLVPQDPTISHPHSFSKGSNEKRCFQSVGTRQSEFQFTMTGKSSIRDLKILKTTGSSFTGFHRCPLTTLKDASDRIFCTTVDCSWKWEDQTVSFFAPLPFDSNQCFNHIRQLTLDIFANHDSPSVQNTLYLICVEALKINPRISQVEMSLPNSHIFVYDLERFGVSDNATGSGGLYYPVADPSGLIEATVERVKGKL